MKKFIIAAITLFAFTASFAADNNSKALSLLKAAYPGATQIHYKEMGELVSIRFVADSTQMEAFYNSDGEQVAISRTITLDKLPLRAGTELSKQFPGYTTTDVIEMNHSTEGTSYYVSLVNSKQHIIAQVSANGEVSVFKKAAR